jgi:hypothetical protein
MHGGVLASAGDRQAGELGLIASDKTKRFGLMTTQSTTRTPIQLAWSRCGWLAIATGGLWMLLLAPAWFVAGREALVGLSAAALLCAIPGFIVFWLAAAYGAAGAQVPLVILGATVLRMVFVFLGMIIVQSANHRLGMREFVVWLLAFYVVLLAVETLLVLPRPSRAAGRPTAGGV